MKSENFIKSSLISATAATVIIVVLTVYADLEPSLKSWLASTFIHHWIGKGVLSIAGFLVSLVIFSFIRLKFLSLSSLMWFLVVAANASVGIITLFFLYEAFLK